MVDTQEKTGNRYIEQMSAEAIRECVGGEDVRTWFEELKGICMNGNNSEKIKAIALALRYVAQEPVRKEEKEIDKPDRIIIQYVTTKDEMLALEQLKEEILTLGGTEEQMQQRVGTVAKPMNDEI